MNLKVAFWETILLKYFLGYDAARLIGDKINIKTYCKRCSPCPCLSNVVNLNYQSLNEKQLEISYDPMMTPEHVPFMADDYERRKLSAEWPMLPEL